MEGGGEEGRQYGKAKWRCDSPYQGHALLWLICSGKRRPSARLSILIATSANGGDRSLSSRYCDVVSSLVFAFSTQGEMLASVSNRPSRFRMCGAYLVIFFRPK